MIMEQPWKTSILQLQDMIGNNIAPQDSPEAQEHLQSLIECIQELYGKQQHLKEELLKVSIKADAMRHNLREKKKTQKKEKEVLTQDTIEEGCKEINTILHDHREKVEDLKVASEIVTAVEEENEEIESETMFARAKTDKMSFITNTMMTIKHETVIKIKENRRDAYDAHDTVYGVVHAIKDLQVDTKAFCEHYTKEVTTKKSRTKVWNTKVKKEDKALTAVQKESKQADVKLFQARRSTEKNLRAFSNHTEKLQGYQNRVVRDTRQLELKTAEREGLEKINADIEEKVTKYKTVIKQKIRDKCQEIREIDDTAVDERDTHEEVVKLKKKLVPILERQRKTLEHKRCDMDETRQRVQRVAKEVGNAMDLIVAQRAKRMGFKEDLIINADKRETMENVYALKFEVQYAKLRNETVLRMTAAREVTTMLEEHENHLAEFDHYRRTCLDATDMNRDKFFVLRTSGCDMVEEVQKRKERIGELRAKLMDALEDLEEAKENAQIKTRQMTLSVENKRADIQYLREYVLTKVCKNILVLKDSVAKESEVNQLIMVEYGKKFWLCKTMQNDILNSKSIMQKMSRKTIDWKKLLQQARLDCMSQLMRHVIETWKSSRELYLGMWRFTIIKEANEEIRKHIQRLLAEKTSYLQERAARQRYIDKNEPTLTESRQLFRKLVSIEAAMTNSALNGGSADLKIIQGDLRIAKIRCKETALVSSRLDFTLTGMNQVMSGTRHMRSDELEEMKKRMLQKSRRRLHKKRITL